MGGLLKTAVLLGLLGAACIFVVEGQELTSTETVSKDKVIQVGFMNFKHDDQQEDKLKTALQSDTLLSGKGPAWVAMFASPYMYCCSRMVDLLLVVYSS